NELKRIASREVLPWNIGPEAYLNADDMNQLLQAIRQRPRTLEIRLDVRLLDARGKATLNQLAGTRIKVVDVALTEQPCMPEDAKALTKQWLAWFQRSNADAVKQAMDKPQNRLRIL